MSAGEKRALLRLISSSCSAFSRSNEFEEVMMKAAPPGLKAPGSSVLAPPLCSMERNSQSPSKKALLVLVLLRFKARNSYVAS
jgi:hypothetical protein